MRLRRLLTAVSRRDVGWPFLLLAGCCILSSCAREIRTDYRPSTSASRPVYGDVPEYTFGVDPMRPTSRLWHRYAPLIQVLNSKVSGFRLRLASALTYEEYHRKLQAGEFDIGVFEPNLVLEAEDLDYEVFARVGAKDRIAGALVVRSDSDIRSLRDLRGRAVYFGPEDTLASSMMVRFWLRQAGVRGRQTELVFTTSQESALLEVISGTAAAAGASRVGWREFQASHPEEAELLEARWWTEDLSGPAVMAHARIPVAHVEEISRALLELEDSPAGLSALDHSRFSQFRPAVSASYDDVWEFLNAYHRVFGPPPGPGGRR